METQSEKGPEQGSAQAVAHITSAHEILKGLQEKHPEVGAAITKLEMALNLLAVGTSGLL